MISNNNPQISIIVPVYNAEKYLCECIDSIIAQTFTDWELILVEDGAKDNSPAICDEYALKDSRVKVIHKKNEGVAIARKTGCDIANAGYISFVDSDDTLHKNCLEKCVRTLKDNNVDILVFGSIWQNETTGKGEEKLPEYEGLYDKRKIRTEIFPLLIQTDQAGYYPQSIWTNIYKKECISQYLIADRRAVVGEDGACVIPAIYHAESIYYLKDVLYNYRINEASATGGRRTYDWDCPEVTARHIERNIDIDDADFREQLYRRVCHDVFNVAVSRFYTDQSYRNAAREIRQNLNRDYYRNAIRHAHFSGSKKAALMMMALKTKSTILMRLYANIKK